MAERKSFLIRIDPATFDALNRWANDEFRSLNAHLEYLLHQALRQAGRLPKDKPGDGGPGGDQGPGSAHPGPGPGWGEDA